ncbi:VOC family protein [Conexibacter sp. CPCC 206217]|uniref:VOC family protein n=1 Tax=Conexibacter sp. CPCC 206217 TaxID=3064574 RepID=UPI002723AC79|nr:VOC family protein [Conexibacter sp. CPCC 206217]MDO8212071.1 VOC family protein [Conexibacter sp. CPCC 206217]
MEPLLWHGQLSHIALRCADVPRSGRFYADAVGLTEHPGGDPDGLRLGWGAGQHALDLLPGAPGLDHYGLEIPDAEELERLLERVRGAGVEVGHRERTAHDPETFLVSDPEGRRIELHGRVDRSGEFRADPARRPTRLQHITFATRSVPDLAAFYEDVLGMRVSDRMGSRFAWLRCGAEHHTVAMVQAPSATLLDHFSFDLSRWDDFASWSDRLSGLGVPLSWGPGRHGPGNNLFVMFDDPDGNHIELSAEMELYHDELAEYQRTWIEDVRTTNLWGIAPTWRPQSDVAAA